MAQTLYPVLAEWDEAASAWTLSAPDFPEAVSWAPATTDLVQQAADMLGTVADLRREQSQPLPSPDDALIAPARSWPAGSPLHRLFYLPVLDDPAEPVRINISLDKQLLALIDQEANRRGRTRSGFLAEGARRLLREGASKA